MPSPARSAAIAVLGLRLAYGAGLIAAPQRLAQRWLGPTSASAAVQVPLRGLGARELVIHGFAIAAALRGEPLRPYLAASAAGDVSDILATLAGRSELPDGAAGATVAVAGASALISGAVAAAVEC